ncbi:unnamed protein product [Amoebophrya sp. A120]|nr:unnamed protein product [Amoebophrya sp. A120]|eukprot:GSA120T00020039001.1
MKCSLATKITPLFFLTATLSISAISAARASSGSSSSAQQEKLSGSTTTKFLPTTEPTRTLPTNKSGLEIPDLSQIWNSEFNSDGSGVLGTSADQTPLSVDIRNKLPAATTLTGKKMEASYPENLFVVKSPAIRRLMSIVRDKATDQFTYVRYSDRAMRLLVEEALSYLPHNDKNVETACGTYEGSELVVPERELAAVSVVRSGNTMLEAVRQVIPDVAVGHILVQRDESDPEKKPKFYYQKMPNGVEKRYVLLCDPMLATGGSANAAIKCLIEEGKVKEENILFVNLVAAPEGVKKVFDAYPKIKIVSAEVDPGLNESKFIVPGLGDFGDRYYNTGDEH